MRIIRYIQIISTISMMVLTSCTSTSDGLYREDPKKLFSDDPLLTQAVYRPIYSVGTGWEKNTGKAFIFTNSYRTRNTEFSMRELGHATPIYASPEIEIIIRNHKTLNRATTKKISEMQHELIRKFSITLDRYLFQIAPSVKSSITFYTVPDKNNIRHRYLHPANSNDIAIGLVVPAKRWANWKVGTEIMSTGIHELHHAIEAQRRIDNNEIDINQSKEAMLDQSRYDEISARLFQSCVEFEVMGTVSIKNNFDITFQERQGFVLTDRDLIEFRSLKSPDLPHHHASYRAIFLTVWASVVGPVLKAEKKAAAGDRLNNYCKSADLSTDGVITLIDQLSKDGLDAPALPDPLDQPTALGSDG